MSAQGGDLADRLTVALDARNVASRRLATNGTLEETRDLVETLLADLLDRPLP